MLPLVMALWAGAASATQAQPRGHDSGADHHPKTVLAQNGQPATTARSAIEQRFADLPLTIETPAFAPGKKDFTTESEMTALLAKLDAGSENITWRILGKTPGGRDLHLLLLTADGKNNALDMAASRKPIVWIIGQQHGNEPAGCEAALDIARRLTQADLKPVLDKINVVIMPRANPDGAAGAKRETTVLDMNRDHLLLAAPETQMLHKAMRLLPPAMVIDAHEFGAAGRWVERFGMVQASDVLWQAGSHPEIAESVQSSTRELFDPVIEATLKKNGLRGYAYHALIIQGDKSYAQAGGNFVGIARNTFGLYGAVSYLIETRSTPQARENLQRRVGSHVLLMSALLRAAATHADTLKKAMASARNGWNGDMVVDATPRRETRELPMLDAFNGEERLLKIEYLNNLVVTATVTRPVPFGYALGADQEAAVLRLAQHGVRVHRIAMPIDVSGERYIVRAVRQEVGESGAPVERVSTDVQTQTMPLTPGMFFVPMGQPLARIAAMALEPDSVGSLVSVRLIKTATPLAPGVDLPVARVVMPFKVAGPLVEPY
jgi:hypothetical protein